MVKNGEKKRKRGKGSLRAVLRAQSRKAKGCKEEAVPSKEGTGALANTNRSNCVCAAEAKVVCLPDAGGFAVVDSRPHSQFV